MTRILLAALIALAGLLSMMPERAAAAADFTPTKQDRERVRDCLNRHASDSAPLDEVADCAGSITDFCNDQETTAETLSCFRRHEQVWDALLNGWYKGARDSLDPASADALKTAQTAWIAYRDAKCGFWSTRYSGGSIQAVVGANCLAEATAQRAIEMHEIWREARL
ncbi:lysozyme inhibitor LprI family protein [Methyloligella sp. 2.7D]|uniref:lysozyme inhibitor LprI family protein n=1 Tax=unclassified Methyloligella TaxID=2625955 RepID=UPI00157CAA04|nr:lysozyme inhibitor LprI family protein [Methyloligella sp. GL2]QKP78489.1 DUF1311 domain-containing protein [Methyloligella sp. GL2]